MKFPIEKILATLQEYLKSHNRAWIQSPTGSGKSTALPLSAMHWDFVPGKIYVVVPRRIAAAHAAKFCAQLNQQKIGEQIGYQVKDDIRLGSKLNFVTDGLFLRLLQQDPELQGTSLVILDEIHERRIQQDLLYYLLGQTQEFFREDLKLLFLSATLDKFPIPSQDKIFEAEGRLFPVSSQHYTQRPEAYWLPEFQKWIEQIAAQEKGSILVFLPGLREILRLQENLKLSHHRIYPLYGALPFSEQQKAIQTSSEARLILTTNIAESSLTIDGITAVIDSGWERSLKYSASKKRGELQSQRISWASATQRMGRAGRTQEGTCYRFWPSSENSFFRPQNQAELFQSDLGSLELELCQWGDPHGDQGEWIEAPKDLSEAQKELQQLKIIDYQHKVLPAGKLALQKSLSPRLGKLIHYAGEQGLLHLACSLSLWLQETGKCSVDLWENLQKMPNKLKQKADTWFHSLEKDFPPQKTASTKDLTLLLAIAYPEWIAYKRQESFALSGGGEAFIQNNLWPQSSFLAIASFYGSKQIAQACPISLDDLEKVNFLTNSTEARWEKQELKLYQIKSLGKIKIQEKPYSKAPTEQIKNHVGAFLQSQQISQLLADNETLERIWQRILWFSQSPQNSLSLQELQSPEYWQNPEEWFFPFWKGEKSLKAIQQMDWNSIFAQKISWELYQEMETLCPTSIAVPSGRKASLTYSEEGPMLRIKLQEMFGCLELTLPDKTPIQIEMMSPGKLSLAKVKDLPFFWKEVYPQVRKEVRSLYKRHPWPENPLEAVATSLTSRALARKDS